MATGETGKWSSLYDIVSELTSDQGEGAPKGSELLALLSLLNLMGILDFIHTRVPARAGSACDETLPSRETTTGASQAAGPLQGIAAGLGGKPDLAALISNLANQMGLGNKISPAMVQALAGILTSQLANAGAANGGSKKGHSAAEPAKSEDRPKKVHDAASPEPEPESKPEVKAESRPEPAPGPAAHNNLDWRRQWKKA